MAQSYNKGIKWEELLIIEEREVVLSIKFYINDQYWSIKLTFNLDHPYMI